VRIPGVAVAREGSALRGERLALSRLFLQSLGLAWRTLRHGALRSDLAGSLISSNRDCTLFGGALWCGQKVRMKATMGARGGAEALARVHGGLRVLRVFLNP